MFEFKHLTEFDMDTGLFNIRNLASSLIFMF